MVHYEMVNILVMLRLWAKYWTHKKIVLYVDIIAVVNVCNSGYTTDDFLGACIRNAWLITSECNIDMTVRHIAGKRTYYPGVQVVFPIGKKLENLVNQPIWHNVHKNMFQLDYSV